MKRYGIVSVLVVGLIVFCSNKFIEIYKNYKISIGCGSKVKGTMDLFSGNIVFQPDVINSSVFDVKVISSSINTGIKGKDHHAMEWLETNKYPEITYSGSDISKSDSGYILNGFMTIKDVKRLQPIYFNYIISDSAIVLKGNMKFNRKDYKVDGSAMGKIEDTVYVDIVVPVYKK